MIRWMRLVCMVSAELWAQLPPVFLRKKLSMPPVLMAFFSATCINFSVQGLMVVVAVVFAVVMTWIIFKIVDAVIGMRVEEKNEIVGLDLTQQSEAAYTVIE